MLNSFNIIVSCFVNYQNVKLDCYKSSAKPLIAVNFLDKALNSVGLNNKLIGLK